jgi:two-component system OmpR family response regulator
MMLASFRHAEPVDLASARRERAGRSPARQAASALVLFVGSGCRPAAAQNEMLARDGVRSLWLPTLDRALEAALGAQLDAMVLDAPVLGPHRAAALADARVALPCPIVMLADEADEIDEIMALELGADAYLLRPVSPRRLRAYLSALMRLHRTALAKSGDAPGAASDTDAAGWRVDRLRNRLLGGSTEVALTEAQSAFLQCLLESPGRIVPRERLIAALPLGQRVHARSIDVYIHRLRKRLQACGVFEILIEAIRSRGYVLQVQS